MRGEKYAGGGTEERHKQGLISVIVPIYQVESELPRCLDSLLAQTYSNFELLLIDDGSPDGCARVMEEYARKDARIRTFHKENGGVSSARNMGLEQAQGEYVCFVDPDDWVAPRYLEWLHDAVVQSGLSVACCFYKKIERLNENLDIPKEKPETYAVELKNCSMWEEEACFQCWRIMVKAELIRDIRFSSNLVIGEDLLFVTQVLLKAERYACVPCELYAYWVRPNSATNQKFVIKQLTEIDAWEQVCALAQNRGDMFEKTCRERLACVYADLYYRMAHSSYVDKKEHKELVPKIRNCRETILHMPNCLKKEKGKAMLMMVICPQLGQVMWRIGKKMKQVSP